MEQLIFLSENLRVSVGLFKCKRVDSSPVATNVEQNVTINRRELPTYENKKNLKSEPKLTGASSPGPSTMTVTLT